MYGMTCTVLILSALLIGACASNTVTPDGSAEVRSKLTDLQNNPELSSRAPVEIREAEEAVKVAEAPLPQSEANLGAHRVYMADHQVEIAKARATTKFAEDQRAQLNEDRGDARLRARTREADQAHADTQRARDSEARARQSEADMQHRLDELEAEETERGMVVTLGDVLFDTSSAQLRGNASQDLDKLVSFLNEYPDRGLLVEGHTDNVGTEAFNLGLSRQRAESVTNYLTQRGISPQRLSVSGLGLERPIANNDTAQGRQQNRRVEIVIQNPPQA